MELKPNSEKFPRSARLLTPAQYSNVFSSPKKFYLKGLLALCCVNNEGNNRLGLAIAKKNLPKAVDRNRVKRLVRDTFRKQSCKDKGIDVVVLSRNPIVNMDNTQILKQLDILWRQVQKRDW